MNFSPKRVAEVQIFSVDFSPLLAAGETLSAAVWSVALFSGTDPTPNAMLQGPAVIAGSVVSQVLKGGVAGGIYGPICTATTSLGQTLVVP
jgi:hypothetical protein